MYLQAAGAHRAPEGSSLLLWGPCFLSETLQWEGPPEDRGCGSVWSQHAAGTRRSVSPRRGQAGAQLGECWKQSSREGWRTLPCGLASVCSAGSRGRGDLTSSLTVRAQTWNVRHET